MGILAWLGVGVIALFALAVIGVAVHVHRQPRCPACQRQALYCQSRLQLDSPEAHAAEQAYYECLSCEAAFVRYDEDWRQIPRDELPSAWLARARKPKE